MQELTRMENKDHLIKASNAFDKPKPSKVIDHTVAVATFGTIGVLLLAGVAILSGVHDKSEQTYQTLNSEAHKTLADKNTDTKDIIKLFDRIATYDTTCQKLHQMEKIDPSIKEKQTKLMKQLNTGKANLANGGYEMSIHTKIHNKRWQITVKEVDRNDKNN